MSMSISWEQVEQYCQSLIDQGSKQLCPESWASMPDNITVEQAASALVCVINFDIEAMDITS